VKLNCRPFQAVLAALLLIVLTFRPAAVVRELALIAKASVVVPV
jgi:hypothetical protein